MAYVFVPRRVDHNYSDAERFGKISEVFGPSVNVMDFRDQHRVMETDILPISSEDDYVLPSGPTVMNLSVIVPLMRKHGFVNLLMWNSRRRCYVHRRFFL